MLSGVIFLFVLAGCSTSGRLCFLYELEKFESNVLPFDPSKPNDVRIIAATLRVYEIAPEVRKELIHERCPPEKIEKWGIGSIDARIIDLLVKYDVTIR